MDVTGAVAVPFAVLLVVAGIDKLRSPDGARQALVLVGVPHHPMLVRGLPTLEIAAGVGFLVIGGRVLTAVLAVTYLAFAAVVVRSLSASTSSRTCGCFGADSSELSALHLTVDLLAAAAFVAAGLTGAGSPLAAVTTAGAAIPAIVMAAVVSGWLLRSALVDLPDVLSLVRRAEVHS